MPGQGSVKMISRVKLFLFAGLLSEMVFGLAGIAQAQTVALGASNVAGRGVSSSEAFPAQLERMRATMCTWRTPEFRATPIREC